MYNLRRISSRIKKNEDFRNKVYRDILGNYTIGYGHLIKTNDCFVVNKLYSKKHLAKIFNQDLKKSIQDFKKNYDFKKLSDNVQEVLIEMIFQMGINKVLKFKKFNFYLKQKKPHLAALQMMKSLWYTQTPKRVDILIKIFLGYDEKKQ